MLVLPNRNAQIKEVENELKTLNSLFLDLESMIEDQGKDINIIDQQIINVNNQIKDSEENLVESEKYNSKYYKTLTYLSGASILLIPFFPITISAKLISTSVLAGTIGTFYFL